MSTPTAQSISEIIVQHCTVTVVRRGGWSWGPDPHALVQLILDGLPDLLESHFSAQLAADSPDLEIVEPVTITVRLGQMPAGNSAFEPVEVFMSPMQAVEDSVPFEDSFVEFDSWLPQSVAGLFAELAERGDLEPLLALLPEESIRVYLLALLSAESADVSSVARRLIAELISRRGDQPADLVDFSPENVARLVESSSSADAPLSSTSSSSSAASGESVHVDVVRARGETQVCSVLPFLLAGPLARIGYLDAIGPALAGLDMADEAPLFAAALAYKVLGVTSRGWRYSEQDSAAAATFAGLDSPMPELTDFARRVRPALPVLDAVLALSLCRGHDPRDPLLITGVDNGVLLVDAQGMFPIAWAADVPGLVPHWQACGRPPVLVCDSQLPAGCLRQLAAAGVRFMTDVRPLRGDPVSRLPWRTPMWTAGVPDLRLAVELPGHAARLDGLMHAMVVERRAVPLASDNALERSVTLAASLGLGTIAWMLWRDRETPDPVLALTRFTDLDASVRFSSDAVRVRIPLGRRHADLLRGGLLSDVPGVVWLGGRTLTFSGG
ncbi:hypothetical protein JOF56_010775 [Kibdelosporangium banguiense]|uniref:Uncharacterized protein n=1 Tax=Kibdelosporangium banguiense TaxID=1365924 RepID=A0ABS4U154_9PSEU|nr:hypothetical protein [Kibdelosporangium banguiense]MBP2330390.1 hypothetical protein [Kibdelosporangium banguiense]